MQLAKGATAVTKIGVTDLLPVLTKLLKKEEEEEKVEQDSVMRVRKIREVSGGCG